MIRFHPRLPPPNLFKRRWIENKDCLTSKTCKSHSQLKRKASFTFDLAALGRPLLSLSLVSPVFATNTCALFHLYLFFFCFVLHFFFTLTLLLLFIINTISCFTERPFLNFDFRTVEAQFECFFFASIRKVTNRTPFNGHSPLTSSTPLNFTLIIPTHHRVTQTSSLLHTKHTPLFLSFSFSFTNLASLFSYQSINLQRLASHFTLYE